MKDAKVVLNGFYKVVRFFAKWLKTPEDVVKTSTAVENEHAEALKKIAEKKSLDVNRLTEAYELFVKMGYRKKKIKEILGPNLEKLVEVYEDLRILEDLKNRGVLLKAETKVINGYPLKDDDKEKK